MITEIVSKETTEKWNRLFELFSPSMIPNRKKGKEIDEYFREKYSYQVFESEKFKSVVTANILGNKHSREKLPQGMVPQVKCYTVGNVYIGIDIISGEFHIECDEIEKAIPIYDDLFVYRGLDKNDLKNFVLVGQFVELTET